MFLGGKKMKEDLCIDFKDGDRLNIRTAGIIIHDNKILFHKNPYQDYYALFGGRIKISESSIDALKREVLEEMGKEIEFVKSIGVIENFFNANDKNYHEILFVSQVEFKDAQDKKILDTIKTIEKEENTEYIWIDINEIKNIDIRPRTIKNILLDGNFPQNIINVDIKNKA